MWKLSTTIKDIRAQPQTVLRVPSLPKGRKPQPVKPAHAAHTRDAEHPHGARQHKTDVAPRARASLERQPHKHDATPKPPRHTKADTVHRWHIPSHVVRHKIKPAANAGLNALPSRDGRGPARHPHRPDLPERITAHPGEVLREEFLKPLGLSVNGLAAELRVPANRIGAIIKGERSVTADTALRLGRYFRTSPEFWMNLQSMHDLTRARSESGYLIDTVIHPRRR